MCDIGDLVLTGSRVGIVVCADPITLALNDGTTCESSEDSITPILNYKQILQQFELGVLKCQLDQ